MALLHITSHFPTLCIQICSWVFRTGLSKTESNFTSVLVISCNNSFSSFQGWEESSTLQILDYQSIKRYLWSGWQNFGNLIARIPPPPTISSHTSWNLPWRCHNMLNCGEFNDYNYTRSFTTNSTFKHRIPEKKYPRQSVACFLQVSHF